MPTSLTKKVCRIVVAFAAILTFFVVPPNITPITVNNKTLEVEGFMAASFRFLKRALKMPYEIIDFGDGEMGIELAPGNYTGVVGRMHRGEADVLSSHLPIMEEHFKYIGFSTSFGMSVYSLLSGPPISVGRTQANFLSSLSLEFWVIMTITLTFLSIGYFFVVKIEGKIIKPNPYKEGMVECFLTFYGLLFQRGFENLPENLSSRLMVVGWLLLVIIVMTDLAAIITSKMAVADVPEFFDYTEKILDFPKIHFYTTRNLYADVYMSRSEDPKVQELWQHLLRYDGLQDYADFYIPNTESGSNWIMDLVSEGKAVSMENVDCTLTYWVNEDCKRQKRHFHIAKEALFMRPYGYLYRKGLHPDIVEFLCQTAARYGGGGFHHLVNKQSGKDADQCLNEELDQSFKPMTLRDIVATLKILVNGLIVSSAVFLIEMLTGTTGRCVKHGSYLGKVLDVIGKQIFDVSDFPDYFPEDVKASIRR